MHLNLKMYTFTLLLSFDNNPPAASTVPVACFQLVPATAALSAPWQPSLQKKRDKAIGKIKERSRIKLSQNGRDPSTKRWQSRGFAQHCLEKAVHTCVLCVSVEVHGWK